MNTQTQPNPIAAVPSRRVLRSVGVVLAGFVTIVVLSTAVDAVLHATGVYPPFGQTMSDALFALATAYRVAISIAGCALTARLAPHRPMHHALALGALGVVVSSIGAIVTWNAGPARGGDPLGGTHDMNFGPMWYPLLLVAVSLPCAFAGARLAVSPSRISS